MIVLISNLKKEGKQISMDLFSDMIRANRQTSYNDLQRIYIGITRTMEEVLRSRLSSMMIHRSSHR